MKKKILANDDERKPKKKQHEKHTVATLQKKERIKKKIV